LRILPSILSHPAVPLAIGAGLGARVIPRPLLAAGIIASTLPDLDVVGFAFGISYGSPYGHRGFSHSPVFAVVLAVLGVMIARALRADAKTAFWFLFIATASHGFLDAFTDGGLGVAFLWPWLDDRYFAPLQVIAVSPIGISRFFSERGLHVLLSELNWVWFPCALLGAGIAIIRHRFARP